MMCCSSRISTVRFQRPNFLLCPGLRFQISNGLPSFQVSLNEDSSDFLSWLQQKAGTEISSALSVGNSIYGRSLFATKFIQAGESILKVPYSVQITPDNIIPSIASFLSDDVGSIAQLAVVILSEQKLGQNSDWAPYINILSRTCELHSTIFWTKNELEMVRQSPIYEETINHQEHIKKEYLKVKSVLERYCENYEDITIGSFIHAYAIVASRAWGTSKGLSLIPFADFLNHNGVSEAFLMSDEDKEISEVIADRDYAAGEEVLISYGKFPNSTLVLDFGFTLPHNIYDQAQIWVEVSQHDPLWMMKLKLLHRHGIAAVTCSNNFDSFGTSFTIKEVRSAKGKGKGIPQALRAFVRVLSTTSPQELKDLAIEAAQSDGRLARCPLKDRDHEIEAHRMLLLKITHMIRDYDASIKSLEFTDPRTISSQHALRKHMARDLLTGELRVLKSASAWLMNYCATLSTNNGHP